MPDASPRRQTLTRLAQPIFGESATPRLPLPRWYYGWWIVVSALLINIASSTANPLVFSFFVGPMSDELGVGKSALALALTFRLVAAGAAAPLLGILLDRHGARWLGAICGLLAGCSMVATAFTHQLWLVYLLFAVGGIAGFGAPAGQLLTVVPITRWFVARRARALAIATTGMAGGTVILAPLTQGLIDSLGWREAYAAFGCVILAAVVPTSLLIVRRSPEDLGLQPDGGPRTVSQGLPLAPHHAAAHPDEVDWTVGRALRTPALWLLLSALAIASFTLTATVVHRVDYWKSVGMSSGLVGAGTAIDPLMVVFTAFLFGVSADRLPIRVIGLVGFLGMAISIVPIMLSDGQAWTIVAHSTIWGFFAGAYITLNNLVWPTYYGSRFIGSIRGIVLPTAVGASAAGPPLYGLLFDAGVEPRFVWLMSVGGFLIAATLVILARRPQLRPVAAAPVALPAREETV